MTPVCTYLIVRKRSHISLYYLPLSLYSTSTLEGELANWMTFLDVQKENNNNNNIMAPTTKTAYVTGQYCTLLYTWGASMDTCISREGFFESIVEKENKKKTNRKHHNQLTTDYLTVGWLTDLTFNLLTTKGGASGIGRAVAEMLARRGYETTYPLSCNQDLLQPDWMNNYCYEWSLPTHTSFRIRVAIADSNLAQAEVVARSLTQDALAVGVDAAKWESQVEAFERVLRDLKRVDYVYASKYLVHIYRWDSCEASTPRT